MLNPFAKAKHLYILVENNQKNMNGITTLHSTNPGPTVGIMAVTHGDEPAGLVAHAFLKKFFSEYPLERGTLILIEGNPEAAREGRICVDENLNRIFQDDALLSEKQKSSREYGRSRELMPILASLDYLLDIHSTSSPSVVFSIMKTYSEEHMELASYLPIEFSSSGWTGFIDGTTCDYADSQGVISVTIECGTHANPRGGEVAILAAQMFLQKMGIHDFGVDMHRITKHLVVREKEMVADRRTFNYSRTYENFDLLNPGELIAVDDTREYRAPDQQNGVIIFPTKIDHIRQGHCKEAFLVGEFVERG